MIKTRADAARSAVRPGLLYQNLYFNAASCFTSRSPQHLCSCPDHRIVNAVHSRKSASSHHRNQLSGHLANLLFNSVCAALISLCQDMPAHTDRVRSEGQALEHIKTGLKSAVHDDFYLIADSFPDGCTVTSDLSKGGIFPVPVLRFSRRLRLYRDPFKYHIIPALGLIFVPSEGPVITKDDRAGTIFVLRLQTLDFSVLVISNN